MFAVRIAGQTVMSRLGWRVSRLSRPHRGPSGLCWGSWQQLKEPCENMTDGSLPTQPGAARKMTLRVWKMSSDSVFSWIRWRGSGKMGCSLLTACAVFRLTSLREATGGAPLNVWAHKLNVYHQATSAHLYISCVTLWWEMICLQDTESWAHGTDERKCDTGLETNTHSSPGPGCLALWLLLLNSATFNCQHLLWLSGPCAMTKTTAMTVLVQCGFSLSFVLSLQVKQHQHTVFNFIQKPVWY